MVKIPHSRGLFYTDGIWRPRLNQNAWWFEILAIETCYDLLPGCQHWHVISVRNTTDMEIWKLFIVQSPGASGHDTHKHPESQQEPGHCILVQDTEQLLTSEKGCSGYIWRPILAKQNCLSQSSPKVSEWSNWRVSRPRFVTIRGGKDKMLHENFPGSRSLCLAPDVFWCLCSLGNLNIQQKLLVSLRKIMGLIFCWRNSGPFAPLYCNSKH